MLVNQKWSYFDSFFTIMQTRTPTILKRATESHLISEGFFSPEQYSQKETEGGGQDGQFLEIKIHDNTSSVHEG